MTLSRSSCSIRHVPTYKLSAPHPPAIATSLPALTTCRRNPIAPSGVALPVLGTLLSPSGPACNSASSVASLYSSSVHRCFLPQTARFMLLFHSLKKFSSLFVTNCLFPFSGAVLYGKTAVSTSQWRVVNHRYGQLKIQRNVR